MKTNIEFRNGDTDGHIICPICGDDYLHHVKEMDSDEKPVYFMENIEDRSGTIPLITKATANKGTKKMINPFVKLPYRGSSIAIPLWCEQCQVTSYLYISQHKGCIYINFVDNEQLK
jgi:uncharacterized Zn finger protein (UPF0148 family)